MKTAGKSKNLENSGRRMGQVPGNGKSGGKSQSNAGSSSLARKATGPRTRQGKEKSKYNATRHGIFSKVAVLKGESRAEFDTLLNGLRNDRQPVGELEEVLVETLATLFWRGRRLLIAEVAEIRAQAEFVEWDQKERYREEAARLPQLSCNGGLIRWIGNPEALQECLDLLGQLKEAIDEDDFVIEFDEAILTKVYGSDEDAEEENCNRKLFDSYLVWLDTSRCSDEERKEEGYASKKKCKENFLEEVNEEIHRLERYRKEQATISACKLELESLRRSVPEAPQLDRLLRYETTISRGIERTLNQLERAQRVRLGQPVPPRIDVSLSSS